MLEKVLKKLIVSLMGNVVEDFTANEIHINKWYGTVEKNNLVIKESFIKDMSYKIGLPLTLKKGIIGKVKANLPWTRLNKQPIKIIVQDVHLLLTTDQLFQIQFFKQRFQNKKKSDLEQDLKNFLRKSFKYYNSQNNQYAFINKIKSLLVDNLRIEVERIHIRIEDNSVSQIGQYFSVGIQLKKFYMKSTDKNFQEAFIDKHENSGYGAFDFQGLGVYMEINNKHFQEKEQNNKSLNHIRKKYCKDTINEQQKDELKISQSNFNSSQGFSKEKSDDSQQQNQSDENDFEEEFDEDEQNLENVIKSPSDNNAQKKKLRKTSSIGQGTNQSGNFGGKRKLKKSWSQKQKIIKRKKSYQQKKKKSSSSIDLDSPQGNYTAIDINFQDKAKQKQKNNKININISNQKQYKNLNNIDIKALNKKLEGFNWTSYQGKQYNIIINELDKNSNLKQKNSKEQQNKFQKHSKFYQFEENQNYSQNQNESESEYVQRENNENFNQFQNDEQKKYNNEILSLSNSQFVQFSNGFLDLLLEESIYRQTI